MEATVKNYPKFFLILKAKIKSLIKKNDIKILRKKYKTNVGRAWADEREIKIPIIRNIESIYIILHEIGHIVLKHGSLSKKPLYVEEMEAELFALNFLRKWDIHKLFAKDYEQIKKRAERYIRWNIMYAIQRSIHESKKILQLKHIHIMVLKFCGIRKFQTQFQTSISVRKRKNIK